jgi:hypothetical protein
MGFLTDGAYELHQLNCSRFQDIYPTSIFIQIDVPPNDKYVKCGRLLGPTFLPISQDSIRLIRGYLNQSEASDSFNVSFIGRIYGYRKKVIRDLQRRGVSVSVNPHRTAGSDDQPSYLEYMGALSRSRLTLNFARANGTCRQQLKSRILESALVGTVPLTDDGGLSELVLPGDVPFVKFSRPKDIIKILAPETTNFPDRAIDGLKSGQPKPTVEEIASGHFWECLELGLKKSGLQTLVAIISVSKK